MMLRVAIVDDEAHARTALRLLLAKRADVEIVAECRNGSEAVEVLRWITVDLLLLDVQMPGLDGFGVLQALGAERVPTTVFVTAFDRYALRAFEVEAVDYLLKPFDEARFYAAFDRARRRVQERRGAEWALRLIAATRRSATTAATSQLPRLPIPVGTRVLFVDFNQIDWIEACDQYVTIHVGSKEHLLRESLQRLAAKLPSGHFARIHRSHIVNLARVREVVWLRSGDGEVALDDGHKLRVSRRYADRLKELENRGIP
jgi:two-component system, LytTR family, response regulator